MNDGFDGNQNLSRIPSDVPSRSPNLSPQQREILRNLEAIGPEIAAYYLDGIKILHSTDLETAASLLAHIAREIDGGLRNILSVEKKEELEFVVHMPNGDTLTEEKRKEGTLKFAIDTPGNVKVRYSRIGKHKPSILQSLGVNEPSPLANRWIEVTGKFYEFVHRHGAWKPPHSIEKFKPIWCEFEDVLASLVGSYLNLLSKVVDRILEYGEPTEEIRGVLPNLLKSEARRKYFFSKLESSVWLLPLKEDGWFDPENNPALIEDPEQPGNFYYPMWHALEYVAKVAVHPDSPVDILVDIVNDIVKSAGDHRNRINNKWTDWQTIKIISTLPVDQIKCRHIAFMGITLKSKWRSGLVDQEISQTILPKLLDAGAKELTLILLKVMFDAKVVEEECGPEITKAAKESTLDLLRVMFGAESVNHEIIADVEAYEPKGVNREITYMQECWLTHAFKEHGESIAKLCGVKAANIALEQIRTLIAEGVTSFDRIQLVRVESSDAPRESYAELLVGFVSRVLRFAEPTTIAQMLEDLLQAPQTIIRRIALTAVTHHYSDLKQIFWQWKGNPLEEVSLKPEFYQLIQSNCTEFKEFEIKQILSWIELPQYTSVFAKNDETRSKAAAYKKREWLSALLKTSNEKVVAADQKYKQINPKPIEHPGLLRRTESWWGETSSITVEKLSRMSNAQIAEYLANFKEPEIVIRQSDPTERGLSHTLEKCVAANPQKFAGDLHPFQSVRNLYQYSLLQGFLTAWRDKEEFDWVNLLGFIRQIFSSEHFWMEQYEVGFNYRNWVLSTTADLIAEGTKDDTHAFDLQLLPLTEEILLILVEKAKPSMFILTDSSLDALSSDRGRVFSAMVDYALRFARTNESECADCRWPYAIRMDFTKRLDRNVETSLEFSYILGLYLPELLDLDKEWVRLNINRIFPQQDEDHWQAAFSGYLLYPKVKKEFYLLLKAHGHYRKALGTHFADTEVLDGLVRHICTGWIEDSETLDDKTSLIYQLIHSGNPNLLAGMVYFFSRRADNLSDKVKIKVIPAWRALFEVLSQHSNEVVYQKVLSPLSQWIGLIDEIDDEVLAWIKGSINYLDKLPGYALTLSNVIKALQKHVLITPEKVGDLYLEIPASELRFLEQTQKNEVEETVRILYKKGHKGIADEICNRFGKAGVDFLRSVYEEYRR